jgi:hypothetical protein
MSKATFKSGIKFINDFFSIIFIILFFSFKSGKIFKVDFEKGFSFFIGKDIGFKLKLFILLLFLLFSFSLFLFSIGFLLLLSLFDFVFIKPWLIKLNWF